MSNGHFLFFFFQGFEMLALWRRSEKEKGRKAKFSFCSVDYKYDIYWTERITSSFITRSCEKKRWTDWLIFSVSFLFSVSSWRLIMTSGAWFPAGTGYSKKKKRGNEVVASAPYRFSRPTKTDLSFLSLWRKSIPSMRGFVLAALVVSVIELTMREMGPDCLSSMKESKDHV